MEFVCHVEYVLMHGQITAALRDFNSHLTAKEAIVTNVYYNVWWCVLTGFVDQTIAEEHSR